MSEQKQKQKKREYGFKTHNEQIERDYQKSRVYKWEDQHIGSKDASKVPFDQIQSLVNYLWQDMGLLYPPKVETLNPKDRHQGKATRMTLYFPEKVPTSTWIVLHELAHTLTNSHHTHDHDADGLQESHGPVFVGAEIYLAERYLKIPALLLQYTAKQAKIDYCIYTKPVFAD